MKVATVEKVKKEKEVTLFHVFVGIQPVYSGGDLALAEAIALEHKVSLTKRGCDLTLPEFSITIEKQTKKQEYFETVEKGA